MASWLAKSYQFPLQGRAGTPVGWADKLLRVAGSIIRLAQCTPNGNALVAAYPRLTFEGSAHDLDTMRELMQGQRRLTQGAARRGEGKNGWRL